MFFSKKANLKPLLESKDGVHLTSYLVNRGDLVDLKSQLRTTIKEAATWLDGAMPIEEQKKFLEPLETLLNDGAIFTKMKGNIGIFRNNVLFRVLNIPIEIEQSCQVATSFHIKPLLRWLQGDQEFLFLGLEKNAAYLYFGNQDNFKLIGCIKFPEAFEAQQTLNAYMNLKKGNQKKAKEIEIISWLNEWLFEKAKTSESKLFVAGMPSIVSGIIRSLRYKNIIKVPVANSFDSRNTIESFQIIRRALKEESNRVLEKILLEFRFAEEGNKAKKNIFQISKAVVQGKVRKLIVTDELNIFGKIDVKSGGLAIHPFDLDHEDDCILDDLAQMVLSQGGEVFVAKRNEIPKGRPILAILDDDEETLEKTQSLQYGDFQENLA